MTPEQAKAIASARLRLKQAKQPPAQQQPAPQQDPGFFSGAIGDIRERQQQVYEAGMEYGAGDITFPESAVRTAGAGAMMGTDIAGRAIGAAAKGAYSLLPDNWQENISSELNQFLTQTPIGASAVEALKFGGDVYENFKQMNPRLAKNVEASLGLLTGGTAVKAVSLPKREWMKDAVTRLQTEAEKLAQVKRSPVSMLRTSKHELDPIQKNVAKLLSNIRGINRFNTNQMNFNVVQKEIVKDSQKMKMKLSMLRKPVNDNEITRAINREISKVNKGLKKSKRITPSEAQVVKDDVLDMALDYKKNNIIGTDDLLELRKRVDSEFTDYAKQRFVDRGVAPTNSERLWEASRNGLNKLLDTKHPGNSTELRRLSTLYDAKQIIQPKAAWEADTILGRRIQDIEALVPPRAGLASSVVGR